MLRFWVRIVIRDPLAEIMFIRDLWPPELRGFPIDRLLLDTSSLSDSLSENGQQAKWVDSWHLEHGLVAKWNKNPPNKKTVLS